VTDKQADDQKIEESAGLSKEGDKSEEPKAVETVSEQLEKLNVGTESDGAKPSETNTGSGGDTVVSATSS